MANPAPNNRRPGQPQQNQQHNPAPRRRRVRQWDRRGHRWVWIWR